MRAMGFESTINMHAEHVPKCHGTFLFLCWGGGGGGRWHTSISVS